MFGFNGLKIFLLLTCLFGTGFQISFAQEADRCQRKLLQRPQNYDKDSESYFLAWIEYGEPGQRALASQKLLELEIKDQYETTRKLWECENKDIIKNSLLLVLFDQKPAAHYASVTELLTKKGSLGTRGEIKMKPLEGDTPPEPFAEHWKSGYQTLYFDWGNNAALRLIKQGYLSDLSFKKLLDIAGNYYHHSHRKEAKEVFDLFENIPNYEVEPEIDLPFNAYAVGELRVELIKFYDRRLKQLKQIKRWYEANKSKLKWQPEKRKYTF